MECKTKMTFFPVVRKKTFMQGKTSNQQSFCRGLRFTTCTENTKKFFADAFRSYFYGTVTDTVRRLCSLQRFDTWSFTSDFFSFIYTDTPPKHYEHIQANKKLICGFITHGPYSGKNKKRKKHTKKERKCPLNKFTQVYESNLNGLPGNPPRSAPALELSLGVAPGALMGEKQKGDVV